MWKWVLTVLAGLAIAAIGAVSLEIYDNFRPRAETRTTTIGELGIKDGEGLTSLPAEDPKDELDGTGSDAGTSSADDLRNPLQVVTATPTDRSSGLENKKKQFEIQLASATDQLNPLNLDQDYKDGLAQFIAARASSHLPEHCYETNQGSEDDQLGVPQDDHRIVSTVMVYNPRNSWLAADTVSVRILRVARPKRNSIEFGFRETDDGWDLVAANFTPYDLEIENFHATVLHKRCATGAYTTFCCPFSAQGALEPSRTPVGYDFSKIRLRAGKSAELSLPNFPFREGIASDGSIATKTFRGVGREVSSELEINYFLSGKIGAEDISQSGTRRIETNEFFEPGGGDDTDLELTLEDLVEGSKRDIRLGFSLDPKTSQLVSFGVHTRDRVEVALRIELLSEGEVIAHGEVQHLVFDPDTNESKADTEMLPQISRPKSDPYQEFVELK